MNILFFVYQKNWQKTITPLLNKLLKLRNRHWFVLDIIIFSLTPLLALLLRLDGHLNLLEYSRELGTATILFLVIKIAVFWRGGFYKRYWRYASIEELIYTVILVIIALLIQIIAFDLLDYIFNNSVIKLPISIPLIDGLFSCIFVGIIRFSGRILERINQHQSAHKNKERVLIIGAGSAGIALVQDMQRNPQLGFYPIAFIDDDPRKLHAQIRGIQVLGDRSKITEILKILQIQKVIIAMPTVTGQVIQEIVDICQSAGVSTSTLPGIHEILNGRVRVDSIRDVRIEDLLRREPVEINIEGIAHFLQNKTVLITGSGGSIGSELCRQIFQCYPQRIILMGHGENSVFNIQQELEQLFQTCKTDDKSSKNLPEISTFIADIRFRYCLEYAFKKFQPDVIFHAAAHKHVPLMELNPSEAISNNVTGTKNLLEVALEYNVKHFVMISTDKAVNPTSVMGASKRIAEMLVLKAARDSGKSYVAVRFGNVLGSRGSVVPTFKKQIAIGGPVTVTHPEMRRYFMTIPEAVQLVLQAVVLGRSGEVLMLNMGEPVKIVDLAKQLIKLSGYEVNKDIEIVFTGLRPGEKLFEELFIHGEEYEPTQHQKLLVVKNASKIIPENLDVIVEALCQAAIEHDNHTIYRLLEKIVPSYQHKSLDNNSFVDVVTSSNVLSKASVNVPAQVKHQGV
jgi:FlaA1/EpsC-like NDP-sugar epimerase